MKTKIKGIALMLLSLALIMGFCACSSAPEDAFAVYENRYTDQALYSYWLSTYKYYFLSSYNNGADSDEFWDAGADDGRTNEEYILDYVLNEVKNRTIALSLFDEYELVFGESREKAIDDDINDKLEYIGSRKEMNSELAAFNMNIDMLREVYIINEKYDMVIDYLFGENGIEKATDEDKAQFFEDEYYCLKLITVYTDFTPMTDESGEYVLDESGEIKLDELSEEEKAQKAQLVNEITAELDGGADFEECIDKYSDADYSSMPNGIFLSSGDYTSYGADVVNAAIQLEVGEYKVLSDDVSTLIVKKYPLPEYSELNEEELATLSTLEERVNLKKKNEKFEALYDDVEINSELLESYSIREAKKNSYY